MDVLPYSVGGGVGLLSFSLPASTIKIVR
jgi:hypothetical protein